MADNYTLTGQGPNPIVITHVYKESLAFKAGDLVWMDTNDSNKLKPMTSFTWDTNIGTTGPEVHDYFAGIAMEARFSSDATAKSGQVIASGEVTRTCAALGSAYAIGQMVGPAKSTSANTVDNTLVAITTDITACIGRLTKPAAVGDTSLTFMMQAAIPTSGVQAIQ